MNLMAPPLVILGLDPGVARLGFGAVSWQAGVPVCLDYGCLTTEKAQPLAERLLFLSQELKKLFTQYKPEVVGVETIRFAQNRTSGVAVAEARGLILAAAAEAGKQIVEISPLQVKQSLTAYGQAGKNQVQLMVQKLLKLSELPQPDDAADALAVAIAIEPIYRQQVLINQKV
jgi:crossover junction endodeoxyribonuclease RuvC